MGLEAWWTLRQVWEKSQAHGGPRCRALSWASALGHVSVP